MLINQKLVEVLHNILTEQNKQLLKIIAEEMKLDYNELITKYIISRTQFKELLLNHQ
jgi:hypothetical protein